MHVHNQTNGLERLENYFFSARFYKPSLVLECRRSKANFTFCSLVGMKKSPTLLSFHFYNTNTVWMKEKKQFQVVSSSQSTTCCFQLKLFELEAKSVFVSNSKLWDIIFFATFTHDYMKNFAAQDVYIAFLSTWKVTT